MPAGPILADAWTWSTAEPAPRRAGLKVRGGNSSHHPGCPCPAWIPAFLIPQLLSTLWMRRIRHTQLSGQGPGPNLTAWAPGVHVQALEDGWIFLNIFVFRLFSPQRCQLNLSSQLLQLWKSDSVDLSILIAGHPRCQLVDSCPCTCLYSTYCLVDTYLSNAPEVRFS